MSFYEKLEPDKKEALKRKGQSFSNAVDFGSLAQRSNLRYQNDPVHSKINKVTNKSDMTSKEKMDGIRPTTNKSAKSPPNKIGEIELNTGVVEVGYDAKKDDIVLMFREHHTRTWNSREFVEGNTTRRAWTYGSERFLTNDKSFLGGINVLRTDSTRDLVYIEQQMDRFSEAEQGLTTMNDVLDFRKTSGVVANKDLPMQDQTFKETKNFIFRQKFFHIVNSAKETARKTKSKVVDDIIFLYMLKKRLAEEGFLNISNIKDIEKQIKEMDAQDIELENETQQEAENEEKQEDKEEQVEDEE